MPKTLTFLCRSCGQRLRAPCDRLGEQGKCPRCGRPLSVPRWYPERVSTVLKVARAALGQRFGSVKAGLSNRSRSQFLVLTAALVFGGGVALFLRRPATVGSEPADPSRLAVEAGTRFTAPPPVPSLAPSLMAIPVPDFPGAMAVWGATGVDSAGHVWFGVSASDGKGGHEGAIPNLSAHLFRIPARDQGAVRSRQPDQPAPAGRAAP